jgi:peptide/nickel transport system ATP-binding protein
VAGTGKAHLRDGGDVLLRIDDLVVEFPVGRTGLKVNAVSGISLDVLRGETLGLVGESGCGKSTTGRAIMQLPRPTSGSVLFEGKQLTELSGDAMREARTKMQMIFQDPISSLNPRRKVRQIVMEPLTIWKRGSADERSKKVDAILEQVGIDPQRAAESQPHQFSGGQCQRISIARSLVLDPSLIICDEPVSALDVSVQAQVLNLLEDLKREYGLTLIFIAHDLAVVKNISDRVAVMYLGKICEVAPSDELYRMPAHHYTNVLLDSIPVPDPTVAIHQVSIEGEPPSPVLPPPGCRFHPRCSAADDRCRTEEPQLREVAEGHFVACHHPVHGGDAPVTVRTATASSAFD